MLRDPGSTYPESTIYDDVNRLGCVVVKHCHDSN